MNIYHFSNLSFGIPFIEAISKHCLENNETNYILVLDYIKHRGKLGIIKNLIERRRKKRRFDSLFEGKNFTVLLPKSVNELGFRNSIKSDSLALVSGFNEIFKDNLLNRFIKAINVHPSILPYYRGPTPSHWVLDNNEKYSGFSFHEMTKKIDSGRIFYQDFVQVTPEMTPSILDRVIANKASKLFYYSVLDYLKNDRVQKILNPRKFYNHLINYRSFPNN